MSPHLGFRKAVSEMTARYCKSSFPSLFLTDKEMTGILFYRTLFFLGPHNKFAAG